VVTIGVSKNQNEIFAQKRGAKSLSDCRGRFLIRFRVCRAPGRSLGVCEGVLAPFGLRRLRSGWNRWESVRICAVCPIPESDLPAARSPAMACELTRIVERTRARGFSWRRQPRPASPLERGEGVLSSHAFGQLFGGGTFFTSAQTIAPTQPTILHPNKTFSAIIATAWGCFRRIATIAGTK